MTIWRRSTGPSIVTFGINSLLERAGSKNKFPFFFTRNYLLGVSPSQKHFLCPSLLIYRKIAFSIYLSLGERSSRDLKILTGCGQKYGKLYHCYKSVGEAYFRDSTLH